MAKTTIEWGVRRMTGERRCGEALVALIEAYGVEHVFGIPGVHTLELYRGLAGSRLAHVLARHEQGAAFMADGYARVTGRPGVCVLISGPGVTNAGTAIAEAYADSIPMLVVSSAIPSTGLGRNWGYLHEISEPAAVTRPFVGASHMVRSPDELPALVAAAFSSFASARPRPVHLSIPTDVLAEPVEGAWETMESARPRAPVEEDIRAAVVLLKQAERPAVLIGGGARRAGGEAMALAERISAPVICTIAAKGAVSPASPLFAGSPLWTAPGRAVLEEADVVLALGTEMAPTDLLQDRLALKGTLIRVDLDPAKCRDTRYDTAVAIEADARIALAAIHAALAGETRPPAPDWGAERAARCQVEVEATFTGDERCRLAVLDAIRATVPPETILVNDMTQLAYTGNIGYPLPAAGRWLYPSGYGTLGYALPAAIGAKVGAGERSVLALAGDSGVLYTASEMATAAQLGLPVALVVWNNRGLRQIEEGMTESGIPPIGVDAAPPDFAALARAFGWDYVAARGPEDVESALRRHDWWGRHPTLIEVAVD